MEKTISKKQAFENVKNDCFYLSEKNLKLVPTKSVKFLIFNLPCIVTCPYATKHCKENCYAVKAQNCYKSTCLPARMRNWEYSKRSDFVQNMSLHIHEICATKAYANAKIILFRIHESGDFYNQQYTDNWLAIMENCKDIKNLRFVCYTKSAPYFIGKKLPANLGIIGSIWDDTPDWIADLMRKLFPTIYTAIEENKITEKIELCRCADCATCQKCFHGKYSEISCVIH